MRPLLSRLGGSSVGDLLKHGCLGKQFGQGRFAGGFFGDGGDGARTNRLQSTDCGSDEDVVLREDEEAEDLSSLRYEGVGDDVSDVDVHLVAVPANGI